MARAAAKPAGIDKSVLPIGEARRYRGEAHLKFVASQPCLICGRLPSDPHRLRFAQKRALGRKVSDEFTVHFAGCITGSFTVQEMNEPGGTALGSIRSRSPGSYGRRRATGRPRGYRPEPRPPALTSMTAKSRTPPRTALPPREPRSSRTPHDLSPASEANRRNALKSTGSRSENGEDSNPAQRPQARINRGGHRARVTTRKPGRDVSAHERQAFPREVVDHSQDPSRRPWASVSDRKSRLQRWLGPCNQTSFRAISNLRSALRHCARFAVLARLAQ